MFTAAPLLMQFTPHIDAFQSYQSHIAWSAFMLLLALLLIYPRRQALMSTIVNQRLLGAIAFLLVAQIVLLGCQWYRGVPIRDCEVTMLFLYFVVTGTAAMSVDITMTPTAIGFGAAFALASIHPDLVKWMLSAGSAIFTINAVFAWLLAKSDAPAA